MLDAGKHSKMTLTYLVTYSEAQDIVGVNSSKGF
jgi:hypothetical protein